MTIREHIKTHRKWKQNPIECALQADDTAARAATQIADLRPLREFLKSGYGITDLRAVASVICNKFFTGTDAKGRKLYYKSRKPRRNI